MVINKEIVDIFRYRSLSEKRTSFLILSFLHYNGHISRNSLIARYGQLNQDTFLRNVNTHKSKINGKWYYDQRMFDVIVDCFETCSMDKREMSIQTLLEYVQLYTNANKSYAINWVFYKIVEPFLQHYRYNYWIQMDKYSLFKVDFEDVHIVDYDTWSPTYYCCEEHDGPYEEYKQSNYASYIGDSNFRNVRKSFINYLNSLKNAKAQLIPDDITI